MTTQDKIKVEDNWKELSKNLVDQCNNYNDFQKAILKCFLESYYEGRKNTIIQNFYGFSSMIVHVPPFSSK